MSSPRSAKGAHGAALRHRQREEARQNHRHLHHREQILPLARAPAAAALLAQEHGDVERLVAQVRERVAGIDGERREGGEDRLPEVSARRRRLLRREVLRRDEVDAGAPELAEELLAPGPVLHVDERVRPRRDGGELLVREEPIGGDVPHRARDLLLQAGDADHEELV